MISITSVLFQRMAAVLNSQQIALHSLSELAEQLCANMDEADKAIIRNKVENLRKDLYQLQNGLGVRQRDLESRYVLPETF